jgi:hypothetical protein
MTGTEFLAYVKRILKRTDKDTEVYEATTDVIADMRLSLKSEEYKEEAYVTGIDTLGEYRIAVPSDFSHLLGDVTLVDDTGTSVKTLNKISKGSYDDKYSDRLYASVSDQTDGFPTDFCVYANQIYIGPVPDSVAYKYFINYSIENYTEIAAGTDPVPFSAKYRNILRSGVLGEVFTGLEAFEEANYWKSIYIDGILKIRQLDSDNIKDSQGVRYNGI